MTNDEAQNYTCDALRAALESMDVVWEKSTVSVTKRFPDGTPEKIRASYVGGERPENVFARLNRIPRPKGCTLLVYEKQR